MKIEEIVNIIKEFLDKRGTNGSWVDINIEVSHSTDIGREDFKSGINCKLDKEVKP